jgi:PAS domain S-box-containing protein
MSETSPNRGAREQLDQLQRLHAAAQHFSAIVESSEDAILSKDLDGVVLSWNGAAEKLFGYTADEIIGRPIRIIIPHDRQAEEDAVLAAVRRGETVDHFETVRRRKDGSFVPISLTVSPIRDQTGKIVGASKIARDLTRVERAQRDALRLASIVDSSDDAIASKDLDGVITSWNRAAERMFGYSADEIIGKSVRTLIPEDRHDEEDRVLAQIRAGHRVEHFETVRRRKDGSLFAVSLTVSPILRPDGTVIGASKIARDISEKKRAEQEREQLLEIARNASRLKDEFLATLSHELRTPLNGIVGYVRLLQMGALAGEKREDAIEAVGRCVTSLTQIIGDVLDVSSIVSGRLRLEIAPVDLADVMRSAVEIVRPAIGAKEIRLEMALQPGLPPVAGDADRLRQVCWNLLSNAVKFTHRGGEIRVRIANGGSQAHITVSDNGAGIPLDFLPFVFDRFRQAETGPTRSIGGLGLGLAICRHLVELQGGRIFAESGGPGTGATFRIELPLPFERSSAAPAPVV